MGWRDDQLAEITKIDSVHGEIPVYRQRPKNLLEVLSHSVENFPDKYALVEETRKLTYKQIQQHAIILATLLQQQFGIQKGDRVGLLMRNTIEFCVGTFGTLLAGGIVVALNTKLKSDELEYILEQSNISVLIADDEIFTMLATNFKNIKIGVLKESEVLSLANDPVKNSLKKISPDENEPAFILYTSGTTGRPKGAVLTHLNAIHACINYERCYELQSTDSTIIAVPIFHGTGLFGQFLSFIHIGGTIVLLRTFNAQKMLELCQKESVTHSICVPTIYLMLLEDQSHTRYHINLKKAGVAGAPMPHRLYSELKKWLPDIHIINTFGLTEATSPAVIMPMNKADVKIGSIGTATPVTLAKVVDLNTREDLAPNKPGELLLKGALIIPYYWNNPEATRKGIIDGWLQTGDVATIDEEGFIYLHDRIKEMINCGGEKVYSAEVENVIYGHPGVLEVAVIPQQDEKYGETVKAVVVPKQGHQITKEEIIKWVSDRLAKYKVPQEVSFTDQLPRNAAGKVIKRMLMEG